MGTPQTGTPLLLAALPLVLAAAAAPPKVEPIAPHHGRPGLPYFAGAEGRGLVPVGAWTEGAPAAGTELDLATFGPGVGGTLHAGWSPSRSRFFALLAEGGVQSVGAAVPGRTGAAAQLTRAGVGGLLHMPGRSGTPFALELKGGIGLLVPEGRGGAETRGFLNPTLYGRAGARFGAGFDQEAQKLGGADFLAAPGAVDHPGTERQSILGLEPVLGVRTWFGG